MELRQYWTVIRRWWWIPVITVVLVALLTLVSTRPWQPMPPSYTTSLSFSIGLKPENPDDGEENYYTALASEYLIDDLSAVVRGSEFANAVSRRLQGQSITVPAGALQGSTQAGKLHRILTISITWGDPDQLPAIADAVAQTIEAEASTYMPRLFAQNGAAYLVDRSGIGTVGPGLRQRLEFPLRLLIALAAGIALAFLVDYLDDRIRGREDVETLGLTVVGEIPRRR